MYEGTEWRGRRRDCNALYRLAITCLPSISNSDSPRGFRSFRFCGNEKKHEIVRKDCCAQVPAPVLHFRVLPTQNGPGFGSSLVLLPAAQTNIRQGFENLISRISRLSALNPLAVSITWGAGGSTKERSLELAGVTQGAEYGIDTVLHLTCTNMVRGMVDDALKVWLKCIAPC